MRLKGTTKDARTLGRELNVRYVLGGSVRRAGHNLRITAQLSDAVDDTQVWAEKYSGTLDDVFDLQERLARQIVGALKLTLTPNEQQALSGRPIKSPLAYELYLKGRQEWNRQTKPSLERAVSFLKQAEAIEGSNLRLTTTLAMVYWFLQDFGWDTALDLMALRQECLARARALDPTSAEGDVVEASLEFSRCEFVAAAYRIRRALKAIPTHHDSLYVDVQVLAGNLGQPDRARPTVARFLGLDPLSYGAHVSAGITELMAGRYAEALAGFEAGLEFEPESFDLRVFRAWALTTVGSMAPAAALYRQLADEASASGPGLADWCQVCACGAEGNAAGLSGAVTPALKTFLASNNPLWAVPLVGSHAMVGLKDEAMDWMERLFARGFADYPHLTRDPLLATLRGFPRFEQFLPVAKAKWEDVARQLADLPPL